MASIDEMYNITYVYNNSVHAVWAHYKLARRDDIALKTEIGATDLIKIYVKCYMCSVVHLALFISYLHYYFFSNIRYTIRKNNPIIIKD
jgi:hypothetical protein